MKEKKINVLYAVDLEDNTKFSLMAIPSGIRCPRELAEKSIREYFGDDVCDNETDWFELIVNAICEDRQIDIEDYTFFFDEVTMYVPEYEDRSGLDDIVTVTCYNKTKKMTRRDALNFYLDAILNSEGAENERYQTIFFQLFEGAKEASDTL